MVVMDMVETVSLEVTMAATTSGEAEKAEVTGEATGSRDQL